MKTGVIDVGGGLRGIYAVGIFEKSILKLRKGCVNGHRDTMKAYRRRRNMSSRAKLLSSHRTIPAGSAP